MAKINYFSPPIPNKGVLEVKKKYLGQVEPRDLQYTFYLIRGAPLQDKEYLRMPVYLQFQWPDFLEVQFPGLSGEIGYIQYSVNNARQAETSEVYLKGNGTPTNPFFSLRFVGHYLEYIAILDSVQNDAITGFANPWDNSSYMRKKQLTRARISEHYNTTEISHWKQGFARSVASGATHYGLHLDPAWNDAILNSPHPLSLGRAKEKFKAAYIELLYESKGPCHFENGKQSFNSAELVYNERDFMFFFNGAKPFAVGLSYIHPYSLDSLAGSGGSYDFDLINSKKAYHWGQLKPTNRTIFYSKSLETIQNVVNEQGPDHFKIFDFYHWNDQVFVAFPCENQIKSLNGFSNIPLI